MFIWNPPGKLVVVWEIPLIHGSERAKYIHRQMPHIPLSGSALRMWAKYQIWGKFIYKGISRSVLKLFHSSLLSNFPLDFPSTWGRKHGVSFGQSILLWFQVVDTSLTALYLEWRAEGFLTMTPLLYPIGWDRNGPIGVCNSNCRI